MAKLGVGVLGVGEMGKRHAENLRRLVPEARLVAIADVKAGHAARVASELEIEHSFGSLEAMLERKDSNAVVIATPDKFHANAIHSTAAAGKDILCEKPLALTLADPHAALDSVARAKVRLQVGFMRHYDPAYAAAMKRIEAGEIGEPVLFKSVGRDKDAPPMSAYQSGMNGMLFYTNTIHDFDLARWLMRDEVIEVHAYTTVAIRPEIAEYGDVVASSVNLKYSRGAIDSIDPTRRHSMATTFARKLSALRAPFLLALCSRPPQPFCPRMAATRSSPTISSPDLLMPIWQRSATLCKPC